MHATSDVRYALAGKCSRFTATVGVDDEVGSNGSVSFEVYADANKVFDSGLLTGASASKQADVSVAGANALRLVVKNGGNGEGHDHADWAGALVVCGSGSKPRNVPPSAVAAAAPTSGVVPLTVTFNGSGSNDPDGSIADWAWDLDGDGQFDDSGVQSPEFRYTAVGSYAIRLRVTDDQGEQSVSSPVTITAAPSPAPPPKPPEIPPPTIPPPLPPDNQPPADGVEKARDRPASASSSENAPWFQPQLANDGDPETRWSSLFADNEWWQVDLGSARKVNAVKVNFHVWAWPKTYTVALSSDGSSWTPVASHSLSSSGVSWSTFSVRTARYVRVTGLTRGTPNGISINEAKVYGPADE